MEIKVCQNERAAVEILSSKAGVLSGTSGQGTMFLAARYRQDTKLAQPTATREWRWRAEIGLNWLTAAFHLR